MSDVDRGLWRAAVALGATAVIAGALGAHGLKERLGDSMPAYLTAVRYQMFGALALLVIAVVAAERPKLRRGGWLIAAGTVLFSGSIYGLVLPHWKFLGPVTPIGGVLMIAGWIALAFGLEKQA